MEAKGKFWSGREHRTEKVKKFKKNAQFWDNAMGDKSNEFHREVVSQ